MKTTCLPSLAALVFAGLPFCPALRAEPLVGIVGQNMVAFDSTSPGATTILATLAGLDIFEQVHAIERKPVSGELYVLTNLSGPGGGYKLRKAYSTGANTVLGSSFSISGSTKWAFALQPDNTTLRVVSNNGVNLRLDSATGARTTDATLVYASGDVSFGATPRVGALVTLDNGDTYGVDIANWNLVTLDPAPSGTLRTVGSTGLALTGSLSVNLDISPSSGTVFFSVGDNSVPRTELHTINLGTGALSPLGQLGNSEIFLALATGVVAAPPAPTTSTTQWAAGPDMARNEKPDAPVPPHDDTLNPNSTVPEWSFGTRAALASAALTLFDPASHTNGTTYPDLEGFEDSNGHVFVNAGSAPIVINNGFGPLGPVNPDEMHIHPSPSTLYTVVRWTCPEAHDYDIAAAWTDIDPYGGNGVSGNIVVNGLVLSAQSIANGGAAATNTTVSLAFGDKVDFVVGSNGDFTFDATRFSATVSKTPATYQWAGGSGPTSLAANWNPARLPTAIDTVRIDSGSPRVDAVLNAAHVINSQTVHFTNGVMNVHASLTNTGTLRLNTETVTFFGNLGIYGDGNIFMENGTLASGAPGDTLFNLGNNIQGAGFIPGIFVNQTNGVVTAGDNGVLHVDKPVANFGFMNASGGSLLAFSGGQPSTLDNSGGTIQANFGGAVFLAGAVSGGRIVNNQNEPGELTGPLPGSPQQIRSPPGAGVFLGSFAAFPEDVEFNNSRAFVSLEGTDINGTFAEFSLLRGMSLHVKGSLQNNGVIRSYGNQTDGLARIYVDGDTVLAGTGRIELGWAGRDGDEIIGVNHTLSLLPGQHLKGGGKVFAKVDNFNSTILADRASATEGTYPLRFYEPIGNYGMMRAQNDGTLDIHSSTLTQYDANYNTVGHVEAGSGGSVTFHGTEIIGGALVQSAGQSAFVYHFATLDGESAPDLELYGTHRAGGENFDSLSVRGVIEFNSGATLELVDGATLFSMGFPELTGFGLVYLGAGGGESFIDIPAAEALHNGIAIAGVGSIGGSGILFNRPGANVQAYGGTLYTFAPVDNQGVLEAGGRPADGGQNVAGTLTIASPVFNELGLVRVNNDLSKLVLYGGSIVGGTIETRGSIPFATATVDLYGKLEDVNLVNNLWVLGDTICDLAGTIRFRPGIFSDSYLVAGGTLGQTSLVAIVGSVILDGPGGVWLVDPDFTLGHSRLVQGDTNPGTLESVTLRNGARIRGAGLVDVDVYNEGGTIQADTPGGSLIIADGRLKNRVAAVPAFTSDQIIANPTVLRPDLASGAIQAVNGATVVIEQSNVLRQQLQATGAGKIVLNGLAPFLSNLHILLEDTAELAAPALLTLGTGVSLALSGDQLPGLHAAASCDIPNLPLPAGPGLKVNGLVGQDGSTLVAAGGGNVQTRGADLVGNDGSTFIATGGGALIGLDGGSLVGNDGGTLVGNDGGTLIGLDGGSLVGNDGSTLKATNGGNLVAAGGGNIEAAGGSLVAAGGGNIANTATGGLVAAGGLNGLAGGPPAYGKLLIKYGGDLTSDASNIRVSGGDRNTVMADNQLGGRMDLKNRTCMKVPSGRFRNTGTLKAAQSNVVTGFFQNVGSAVVSGVSWVWNGAVGAVTGVVNGVGGVINATGSFFGRLFGGAALAEGGEGFVLAGMSVADPSDFINEGTLILGDGITTNTVDMGFTQTNTGMLCVQLGGTATNGYDRLFINGPAVLGGALQLVFTNNFAPTLGDTFDFLVCPDVIGNFDMVEVLGLPADANWQYHAVFTNGAYRVVSDSTVVLPIGAFRALHGLAADGSQDFDNPSGDRIPNLFKFAFNLAPNAGDLNTARYKVLASAADTSGLPRLIPNLDGSFTYVYVRRKASTVPGIAYHPEIDTTLSGTWTALVPTLEAVDSIDATWERVRLTLGNPLPAPYTSGAFLRVRVAR